MRLRRKLGDKSAGAQTHATTPPPPAVVPPVRRKK
jgi:hypothetical protein